MFLIHKSFKDSHINNFGDIGDFSVHKYYEQKNLINTFFIEKFIKYLGTICCLNVAKMLRINIQVIFFRKYMIFIIFNALVFYIQKIFGEILGNFCCRL